VACNTESGMTENFFRFLRWEEAERFRQTFVDFPIGLLENACLVPIFASRILLDSSNFVYKVPTLESNGVVERCQRKLLSLTTSEISRNYDGDRVSVQFVAKMCDQVQDLLEQWKKIFIMNDESEIGWSQSTLLTVWEDRLHEARFNCDDHCKRYKNIAKLGTIFVEVSSSLMEVSTYLPVVDPVVEKEISADYLDEEVLSLRYTLA
jgi:hypothetical protein